MKKKFKFGRNLLSLLIIIGGVVGICLIAFGIYLPVTAVEIYNDTTYTPYAHNVRYTSDGEEDSTRTVSVPSSIDADGIEYITCSQFEDFNITFTSVIYLAKTLTVKLKFEENEKTQELNINKLNFTTRKSTICATAEYADNLAYANSNNVLNTGFKFYQKNGGSSYTSNYYSFTFSSMKYPIKINSFPVIKTIEMPNLYVYVKYQYQTEGGSIVTKKYSIEFTPFDYYYNSKTDNTNFKWITV